MLPHDPDQYWSYTFLGGEIRTEAVPDFREMVRAIAEGVTEPFDSEYRSTVEVYVRCDSDQGEREEWECQSGTLTVRNGPTPPGGGCLTGLPPDDPERLRPDREFYDSLGPERAAVPCRAPGCARGAVTQSLFCKAHQFEQVKKKPCPFSD